MAPKIQFFFFFLLLSYWGHTQPNVDFINVASGFNRPVDIAAANDGSNRLFIVEKAGRIRIISDISAGTVLATDFLNITGLVDASGNEQGLLGLAFDPDYSNNGYFYVNYTYDPGPGLDRTRIARYTVDANDSNIADPNSALTILEFEQDFSNHNGGDIAFGPDGMLYIGVGDGGSGGDPNCRAQDLNSLLGKILRIDVNGTPPASPNDLCGLVINYGIPADNPLAGGSGDCDEIWNWGLRNPWRISFDRLTGDLWVADVGQNQREEINLMNAGGGNYGWKIQEGTFCFDPDPIDNDCPAGTASCGDPGYIDPVFEYNHTLGCSVTGAFVYRGSEFPGMQGYYLCMDYCTNRIWSVIPDGSGGWNSTVAVLGGFGNVTTFGEDESGELYVASDGANGTIYRVIDTNPLPVELLRFEGQSKPAGHLLSWTTRSWESFDRFVLEHRYENQAFAPIQTIRVNGDTDQSANFSFLHQAPTFGQHYYRLRMIDQDQSFTYSPTINITKERMGLLVYPNPTLGTLFIDFGVNGDRRSGQLHLYNLNGQLVKSQSLNNESLVQWDLATLSKGVYLLEALTPQGDYYEKILLR
ncbi:MAG: PQQ-dependent sugar dehydrogenase [Bacteroidota bacterium]